LQADEVAWHPALQETRLLGTHSLCPQGKRLISLHLKLISLRCSYTQKFYRWSGELIAFSTALRGNAPQDAGGVKAALTSACSVRCLIALPWNERADLHKKNFEQKI
jgi:hypothetical protein